MKNTNKNLIVSQNVKKKYPRYVLDPFQIFCIQQRGDYLSSNPHLKTGEITSILGQIWRNMTTEQKDPYIGLAKKLEDNICHVERSRKKNLGKMDLNNILNTENISIIVDNQPNLLVKTDKIYLQTPNLFIVPRSDSNNDISDLSYRMIYDKDENRSIKVDTTFTSH